MTQVSSDIERDDQLAICIKIDSQRKISIFLRRSENHCPFTPSEVKILKFNFDKIKEYWLTSWHTSFNLHGNNLAELIPQALSSFCSESLTNREQEITALTIQGLDNKAIAAQLEISIATVKVHKKSLYAKP